MIVSRISSRAHFHMDIIVPVARNVKDGRSLQYLLTISQLFDSDSARVLTESVGYLGWYWVRERHEVGAERSMCRGGQNQ